MLSRFVRAGLDLDQKGPMNGGILGERHVLMQHWTLVPSFNRQERKT